MDQATAGVSILTLSTSVPNGYIGTVLDRRSPAYVMNMILNPERMVAEHPEARAMLAEYMTPMANQNLTEEEARAIVEYFRIAGRQGS